MNQYTPGLNPAYYINYNLSSGKVCNIMMDSHSPKEFQKKLFAQYSIEVRESKDRFHYLASDRNKPITGCKPGTDFEKGFIEIYIW